MPASFCCWACMKNRRHILVETLRTIASVRTASLRCCSTTGRSRMPILMPRPKSRSNTGKIASSTNRRFRWPANRKRPMAVVIANAKNQKSIGQSTATRSTAAFDCPALPCPPFHGDRNRLPRRCEVRQSKEARWRRSTEVTQPQQKWLSLIHI